MGCRDDLKDWGRSLVVEGVCPFLEGVGRLLHQRDQAKLMADTAHLFWRPHSSGVCNSLTSMIDMPY